MKVALVYDRVNKWGGAERVLLTLHEMFLDAPLYTSVYNPKSAPWAKVFPKIQTSFLQRFPFAKTRHDLYAFLMPHAFESFDFSEFDLVISLTSESAKGIVTGPPTRHLCMCLTPTRYLWSGYEEYLNTRFKKIFLLPVIKLMQAWDKVAGARPDNYVAISQEVEKRIKKYYNRDSAVVYPPVDIEKFQTKGPRFKMTLKGISPGEYFLIVSRLVPYKKIDLAILAFNALSLPLVVVGTGSEEKRLKRMAKPNIRFVGHVIDEELVKYYSFCKALIFPQMEDFGIVAVEAQSAGKPVIAYRGGGALESVVEGKTGIFFDQQSTQSIKRAVEKFLSYDFKPEECRSNAQKYSKERFRSELSKLIKNLLH